MALLESCYCCDLRIASVMLGVYCLVAYVIAFTIELWWILEADEHLPAPAYLLSLGYICILLQSAFLLHGLSVKRTLFLMGWIFVVVIFSIPEAGLVLFMSLYHWTLDHLYGLTELTCWVCRLVINITGLVVVQSLYAQWKDEEEVMQRLQALHLVQASMIPPRMIVHPGNGNLAHTNTMIGYQNDGFVKSTNQGSLRRNSTMMIPLNNNIVYAPPPMDQYLNNELDLEATSPVGCEFNASQFTAETNQIIYNNLNAQLKQSNRKTSNFSRSQSLLDLSAVKFINASGTNEPKYTQSLDRKAMKYKKKASSMSNLNNYNEFNDVQLMNVYTDINGRYVLHSELNPRDYYQIYRGGPHKGLSNRSLAESDDQQRYRDIAL